MSEFLSFRQPDPPPCVGHHALFDSTLRADHIEARKLCDTCPFIIACDDRRQEVETDGVWSKPEGTWAGQLYGYPAGRKRAS